MKISLIELSSINTSAIGVRSLSADLKRSGHRVQLIFSACADKINVSGFLQYPDYVLDQIINLCEQSSMVGISFLSSGFHCAVQITQRLKKKLDIPVVWGGIHATSEPEQCIKYADIVCCGEGERALLELVQKIENGKDYYDTQSFWFNIDGQIIKNSVRPLIQDLDSLPFLDYDIDNEHFVFVGEKKQFCRLDKPLLIRFLSRFRAVADMFGKPVYSTMASRGCPHTCNFCFHSVYRTMYPGQRYLRRRSAKNVISELLQISDRYKSVSTVLFADDTFTAMSTGELQKFAKLYKDKINLPFFCFGSPPTVTEEKMELLTKAGLRYFSLGIQTGSKQSKKVFNRAFTDGQIFNAVKIVNKFNPKISLPTYDIILDNSWETVADELETLNLILELPKPYHLSLSSFRYLPGSKLYEDAKKQGLITIKSKQLYTGEFTKLQGRYVNFLIVLYAYYKLPKNVIKLLSNSTLIGLFDRNVFAGFFSVSYEVYHLWTLLFRRSLWKISNISKVLKRVRSYKG